jgi:hypothetical protein
MLSLTQNLGVSTGPNVIKYITPSVGWKAYLILHNFCSPLPIRPLQMGLMGLEP